MKTLSLILFVLIAFSGAKGQSSNNWSNFRGSQDLSGVTNVNFPDKPKLLWNLQIGDNIKSAAVIADGKIIISGTDGIVYCLDLKGKILWKYKTENSIEAPALILNNKAIAGKQREKAKPRETDVSSKNLIKRNIPNNSQTA